MKHFRDSATVEVPAKPEPDRSMRMVGRDAVDVRALRRALEESIEGAVRFNPGSLGLYATDSSNYRQRPVGVVIPRTLDDVVITHQLCSDYGAPILNRGGGTSLSGETINFAVVIDHSKYLRHIGEPDAVRRAITVECGAINEKVNEKAGELGMVFGPDPSSHGNCTIGGNVGNNSCGVHSVQSQLYGPGPRTSDNVHALDVVTYDGARFWVGVGEEGELDRILREGGRKAEIYRKLRDLRDRYAPLIRERFPSVATLPRRVSGFNLDELLPERGFNVARALVGTEGTCATALQATLLLTPAMLQRVAVVVRYDDVCEAGDDVPDLMTWKPIGLEAIDEILFEQEQRERPHMRGLEALPGSHGAWLVIEFGSDSRSETTDIAERFVSWLVDDRGVERSRIRVYDESPVGGDGLGRALWQVREGGLGATAFPAGGHDHWPGWEDSAVPPDRVGDYLRALGRLFHRYDLQGAMYGHFGQGCIHSRISFELKTADGLRRYRAFLDDAADLVVSYGGSLSGEHGDGQQRAEFLDRQYGPELVQAMREFKQIWDPRWKMNPGKVIDPYRVDENLKLGVTYRPWHPPVKFSYPEDHGDFAHAALRCVGVGKCREPDGVDVMCPSFMVTHEEKHTTRGRARLLFEMLQGDIIRDGWKSKEVYDALDLCLACKGCTSDCPVHVDMPTYKSEFLYHHFKGAGRNRKRHMYAFGFVDQIARIASRVPEVANFVLASPGLARVAKLLGGIDEQRALPTLAPMSLQRWFQQRGGTVNRNGPRVLLWPDTFNNYFHTQVGVACVEGLEQAGFQVVMPTQHVCCGRPLYDYGFLDVAERYLRRTLRQLRGELEAGTPIVGMEPSCTAVFKDELKNLLPHDEDAIRLSRSVYHWAEFFEAHARDVELPRLNREGLVWGHCHHKATGGMQPEIELLRDRMGMDIEEASGGCCGLAGSWGFEKGKYDISMECAEIGLLPAVREAPRDVIVIADGFSCKTQLEQSGQDRRALHTAEVMKLARESNPSTRGPLPERARSERPAPPTGVRVARTAAVIAAGAIGLWAAVRLGKRAGRRLRTVQRQRLLP